MFNLPSLRRTLTGRALLRLAAPVAAGTAVLATAGFASAHVTITPDTTASGSYAVLTVSVPHGCDGSATTSVAINIPASIESVTPTRNPFWNVSVDKQVVTYKAITPLPDGIRDVFQLSVKLPETEGETLVFPVLQKCVKGSTAWTQVAPEGTDHDELEHPAPAFTLTAASEEGHHGGASSGSATGHDDAAEDMADDSGEHEENTSETLALVALGTALAALLVGGLTVLRNRPRD